MTAAMSGLLGRGGVLGGVIEGRWRQGGDYGGR